VTGVQTCALPISMRGCMHKAGMSQPRAIANRLLAHVRLCQELAQASWNEESAQRLERLAADCIRAAREAEPAPDPLVAFDRRAD
jgi:hypothetical protein